MKYFPKSKKGLVLLATMVAAVVAAVGGYAYFTSMGTGSGNATVGSSSNIVISNDTPAAQLFPGGADVTLPVHLQNPGGGNEYVATVSGTVANNGSCLGSWFTVDPITYNAEVNHGATANTSTLVRMSDAATSQDACQGKTLTINWSSN
jgi:hypothetical protein